MSDIVLFIDRLYCIDLFSCIAASLFNKLTYLLTYLLTYDCTESLIIDKPSLTSLSPYVFGCQSQHFIFYLYARINFIVG